MPRRLGRSLDLAARDHARPRLSRPPDRLTDLNDANPQAIRGHEVHLPDVLHLTLFAPDLRPRLVGDCHTSIRTVTIAERTMSDHLPVRPNSCLPHQVDRVGFLCVLLCT
jgi:hypothetical protein